MNDEIKDYVDEYAKKAFGISKSDAEAQDICPGCKKPITPFRNELSMKEHRLSGLCQECQDGVFGIKQ